MSFSFRWIVPVLLVIAGVLWQSQSAEPESLILPRAGCLLVIWGILIESRYVLRILDNNVYTGAEVLTIGEAPDPKSVKEYVKRMTQHIGLIWVVLGTFIWGFGDLV